MLAIDTNLVVRMLTRDDEGQAIAAKTLIDENAVFLPTTVVLESAWVLGSIHGYSKQTIIRALRAFAALPTVVLEDKGRVTQAFDWAEGGLDLADALHLAAAGDCEAFVSFDGKLAKSAAKVGAGPVRAP